MALKIERKPMTVRLHQGRGGWSDFLRAVQTCKVGESFVFPKVQSNHRLALSVAQLWLGASFRAVREGKAYRIGRIG